MTPELAADLAEIRRHRFLFSHHSVGRNILAGIERLDGEAGGGRLTIRAPEDEGAAGGPALEHVSGGQNGDPASKIRFFAETIRRRRGPAPEVALMKLCYVDFNPSTDVEALFALYAETLEALGRDHPDVRFAHVSVPLMARPTGLKPTVQRLLGREVWEDAANAKRAAFNALLAGRFGKNALFPLADVESRGPDGEASTFEYRGRAVPSLYPGYTDDGGHLNAVGQRVVGAAAIRFLAGAVRAPRSR